MRTKLNMTHFWTWMLIWISHLKNASVQGCETPTEVGRDDIEREMVDFFFDFMQITGKLDLFPDVTNSLLKLLFVKIKFVYPDITILSTWVMRLDCLVLTDSLHLCAYRSLPALIWCPFTSNRLKVQVWEKNVWPHLKVVWMTFVAFACISFHLQRLDYTTWT